MTTLGEVLGDDPAAPAPVKRDWREVFGVEDLVIQLMASDVDDLVAVVKARHRKLIAKAHPDAGGTTAAAAEINAALDEAIAELDLSGTGAGKEPADSELF